MLEVNLCFFFLKIVTIEFLYEFLIFIKKEKFSYLLNTFKKY